MKTKARTYYAPHGYNYDSKGNLIAFSKGKNRKQYFAPKGYYFDNDGNLVKNINDMDTQKKTKQDKAIQAKPKESTKPTKDKFARKPDWFKSIESFVRIANKDSQTWRVKNQLEEIQHRHDAKKNGSTPHIEKIRAIQRLLVAAINKNAGKKKLKIRIEAKQLAGLESLLKTVSINTKMEKPKASAIDLKGSHSIKTLNGFDMLVPATAIMGMNFETYKFDGKWNEMIGEPDKNFHMVIFSDPGEGKSTFAIQFANYLATKFAPVLFNSNEEGFRETLKNKLALVKENVSQKLFISDSKKAESIASDIAKHKFKFVFIDSLDNIGITADALKELKAQFHETAFITISQVTKDSKVRGSNALPHDADIVIQVVDGIARTTKNRFKFKNMEYEVF